MALDTDAVLWDLLNDAPGEIYDVDDIEEEKFDVEQYINGNTDYWYKLTNSSLTFSNDSQNHNSPWKFNSFHTKL